MSNKYKYTKKSIDKRRLWVNVTFKDNMKCMDCKKIYPPYVMDFDHRDPKEKKFGISSGLYVHSKQDIK